MVIGVLNALENKVDGLIIQVFSESKLVSNDSCLS